MGVCSTLKGTNSLHIGLKDASITAFRNSIPLYAMVGVVHNVTFEPGCRNNWHVHHASEGGGQILVCVAGHGYYQEWGKDVVKMKPGDCINIPTGVKHWHGATPDSWFSHLAIEVPGKDGSNEWLEEVSNEQYLNLK